MNDDPIHSSARNYLYLSSCSSCFMQPNNRHKILITRHPRLLPPPVPARRPHQPRPRGLRARQPRGARPREVAVQLPVRHGAAHLPRGHGRVRGHGRRVPRRDLRDGRAERDHPLRVPAAARAAGLPQRLRVPPQRGGRQRRHLCRVRGMEKYFRHIWF